MKKTKMIYVLTGLLLLAVGALEKGGYIGLSGNTPEVTPVAISAPTETSSSQKIRISQGRINHILYGDEKGGGHLSGAGKSCKSEFPPNWDARKIIGTVRKVAANDNLSWKRQDNGYYVAEQAVEGVNVRVVLGRDRQNVVTAYPANTQRNACYNQ